MDSRLSRPPTTTLGEDMPLHQVRQLIRCPGVPSAQVLTAWRRAAHRLELQPLAHSGRTCPSGVTCCLPGDIWFSLVAKKVSVELSFVGVRERGRGRWRGGQVLFTFFVYTVVMICGGGMARSNVAQGRHIRWIDASRSPSVTIVTSHAITFNTRTPYMLVICVFHALFSRDSTEKAAWDKKHEIKEL